MIARWRAEVACDEVYALGEGPLWDGPRDRALWLDILAGTVHEGGLSGDRIDTGPGIVYVREYAPMTPRRVLIDPDGHPDGMCVDSDGNLWVALWGSGEVHRYSPTGELTGVVEVGVPHVSCPAFVGPALDRLLITTATKDLPPDKLAEYPDSGRLFLADVGATGLPATPWAGFH